MGGRHGLSNGRLRCVCSRGRSLLGLGLRRFFRFLRFGEPEIAIAVEYKSQSNQKQNQRNDHHAPLFSLLRITNRGRGRKQTIGLWT